MVDAESPRSVDEEVLRPLVDRIREVQAEYEEKIERRDRAGDRDYDVRIRLGSEAIVLSGTMAGLEEAYELISGKKWGG